MKPETIMTVMIMILCTMILKALQKLCHSSDMWVLKVLLILVLGKESITVMMSDLIDLSRQSHAALSNHVQRYWLGASLNIK